VHDRFLSDHSQSCQWLYAQKDVLVNADAMYAVRPSGGFLSTSTDMILWDKVLREKNIILKKENWELLCNLLLKLRMTPLLRSIMVWMAINELNGRKVIQHGGSNIVFVLIYRFVNDGLSIIIMTNTDEANPGSYCLGFNPKYLF
jgi:hypothetical protein